MRKIREVFRWKWELELSHREIAKGLGVSLGHISSTAARAKELGLGPEEVTRLSDVEIEEKFYGPCGGAPVGNRPPLEYLGIHGELKRKGVTLELLHEDP